MVSHHLVHELSHSSQISNSDQLQIPPHHIFEQRSAFAKQCRDDCKRGLIHSIDPHSLLHKIASIHIHMLLYAHSLFRCLNNFVDVAIHWAHTLLMVW